MPDSSFSAPRRLSAVLLAALALVAVAPGTPAQAHAFLQDSNPADGAVLTSAPSQLRLRFSESVVVSVTRIEIVGPADVVRTPSRLRLEGGGDDTEDPVELVADLPALPPGAFRVSWQTLSSDDLHRTSGVLVFGIGQQVTATGVAEPLPRGEEAALRWGLFLALSASLGGQLAGRLFRRRGYLPDAAARCERLAGWASVIALALTAGLLADQSRASGIGLGHLFGYQYGHRWLVREAGLLLLLTGSLVARRRPSSRARSALTTTGAAAVGIGSALLGHASAAGITGVLADAAHLTAAATWAGAVAVFAGVGHRRLRGGGIPAAATRSALRGFAAPAASCVAVLAVTGVYLSSAMVGSVDALLLTFYGRTLLLKIGIVVVISLLGLTNHRRLRRAGAPARLALRVEAGFVVLALAAAAVLASSQPAREPQFIRAVPAGTVPVVDGSVADLQQTLAIRPNRPGRNVVLVQVFDTRRPAPAPVSGVTITLTGPDGHVSEPLTASRLADGRWSATAEILAAGRAVVRVDVQRPGIARASRDYAWTVGDTHRTRPATVSTAPIGGWLREVSSGLAAIALALFLSLATRSRLRRPRPTHAELPAGARATPAGVSPGAD